ncbi:hypothetical protein [Rhizobium leguminosarum]|uniref:hypothetical protein n=1 Tax=Rhizobium leguminosarum TaxID=384 RepID=UPI002E112A81|nr:hypothetical protein U8Q02_43610 [Rhizobium leguminosarum]
MEDWTVHPDGGKLALFRRGEAVLVSRNEVPDELRLFVAEGCEAHADVEAALLYLRRGGRKTSQTETCGKDFIADVHARAAIADDRVRPCYRDRSLFWSSSRSNRMCVYCKKDEGASDWKW